MSQIKKSIDCYFIDSYVPCHRMERKYLTMAKFCFASSLAMLVMNIIAAPIIIRPILGKDLYDDVNYGDSDCCYCIYFWTTTIFFIATVCAFFANFIWIPCTIFIKYTYETTVLSAAYKGFLKIWIIMLAFPLVLIVMIGILKCLR